MGNEPGKRSRCRRRSKTDRADAPRCSSKPTAQTRNSDVCAALGREDLQAAIFDVVPDPIAILDLEHRIVCVNRAMADRLGLPAERCVGQPCHRLVHGTDEPPSFCPHSQLLRDGKEHTAEIHEQRLAGDFLVSVSPLRDAAGRLAGSVHMAREVTERRRAERALRDSNARYRSLVEAAQEGIGIVDPDENIVFANPAYCRMLGYAEEELLGRNLRDLADETEYAKYREGTRRRRRGESSRYETVLWHKTRGPRHFSLSASALFDERGSFVGTLGLLIDVTEQKRAEQALREAERMQAEAEKLAASGRMAARIAHEINNPLSGIKVAFQLIKKAVPEDHPRRPYAGRIDREIDRIAGIVRQMLSLQRAEREVAAVISTAEVVEDVAGFLQPACEKHRVTIDLDLDACREPVELPENALRQVLVAVVVNAVEASPQGGRVVVRATDLEGAVELSVTDQGPGVPEEAKAKLFEPFYTTKGPQAEGGLGLGLSVASNLVRTMGGSIRFRSEPDRGTTFTILLPKGGSREPR